MFRLLPALLLTACLPDFPKRDFTEDPTGDYDGDGFTELEGDCDDNAHAVFPGAPETCDDQDNDCDGRSDELEDADDDNYVTDAPIWYWDADGDQFGDDRYIVAACSRPDGYTEVPGDCDDNRNTVYPGATEFCNGGIDDDCDGKIDDGDDDTVGVATWYRDEDADGFGTPDETRKSCEIPAGFVLNSDDCDDGNRRVYPTAAELCDGIDNNCDGLVDDEDPGGVVGPAVWFPDADGDGFGDPALDTRVDACEAPEGHTADLTDCDDTDPDTYPAADEVCDEMDNDCDGLIDNDAVDAPEWYRDRDEDYFGDGSGGHGSTINSCMLPLGYVENYDDCDDYRPEVHPDATESCFTAFDDNCDGSIDDPGPTPETGPVGGLEHFLDTDGDGYGLASDSMWSCDDADLYRTRIIGDCDDDEPGANPAMAETCTTEFDDDCDGDDNDPGAVGCTTLFYDWDGDGYGIADSECRCISVGVYTAEFAGDCVDTDADINPATESCGLSGDITMDMANAVVSNKDGEVKSAGDINGDGYGDLMVANRTFDRPTETGTISNAGVVHIWYGPPPAAMDGSLITGTESADASIVGAAGERVGDFNANNKAERHFGELNGDGYGDLLLAYHTDLGASSTSMNLVMATGPLDGVYARGDWETVFLENRHLHYPLAQVVTDLTTDDLDDVLSSRDTTYSFFFASEEGFSSLGLGESWAVPYFQNQRIKSADWSGDGMADVGVLSRATEHTHMYLHRASAGEPGERPIFWEGSDFVTVDFDLPSSAQGRNDFFFGETNGDGHMDLMIVLGQANVYTPESGTVEEAGGTYIIHGPLDGYPEGEMLESATTVIQGDIGGMLGSSSALADINGDGLDDPALSTYLNTGALPDSYLYYSPMPSGTLVPADANARFDSSGGVRSVGDLNNDGRSDLVFSWFGIVGRIGTNPAHIFYGQPTE